MPGYEKVNKRRLVDFGAVAAEPPGVSLTRQREIVAQFVLSESGSDAASATSSQPAHRPSATGIAEPRPALVSPEVVRAG